MPEETPGSPRPGQRAADGALSQRDEEFLYLVGDGSDLMRAGRIVEALREFERALAISPDNEQALNLKGLCLFRLGRSEEAARVFEGLVDVNPGEPSIRLNLAMVYLKLGETERARGALSHVLAANPNHARAKNLMEMVRERSPRESPAPAPIALSPLDDVPAPPDELPSLDDDVPEPPTLSELDFAVAMGTPGDTPSTEDIFADARSAVAVGSPLGPDDETIDVPAPAEDDFSDLNTGDDEPAHASAETPASMEIADTSAPIERTLPAYDVAAFNAHIARKEAERAAREAELSREVEAATARARPTVIVDTSEPPSETTPAPTSQAAPLLAASTAALRREPVSEPPLVRTVVDDGAASPSQRGERVASLAHRAQADVDGRLDGDLLSLPFKDVLYLRTDLMVALTGELEVEPVNRRYRGRRTDSFFGGPKAALSAAMGRGTALLDVKGREITTLRLDGEDVYLLEGAIVAFTDGIVWENGRLPGENGDDLDIVHLRGDGRIVLTSERPIHGVTIDSERPTTVRADRLVGWQGQVVPFRGPYPGLPEAVHRPAIIRFEGTGTVLVG